MILLPFPFTDLLGSKKRPALVLMATEMDVTVSFITTQLKWQTENDVLIEPTELNGLKKDSLIRLNKLATIDRNLADGILGRLGESDTSFVNIALRKLLKL
ncbi:MAG: type II toxin-antitoxin system PemK/MazF family toxin [Spirosomaceae bacterium]|nr:type II toxin-antitoxin system PemK/MazF family toxin [Spirosomataceae bacterium]